MQKKNILHLPRWYPNASDPQNGVFIEKHIKSLNRWYNNIVLFVKSEQQQEKYKISANNTGNINTVFVCFKKHSSSIINLLRYIAAFKKGLKRVIKENGKPDLIHIHVLLRNGILGWYYSKRFNVPYLISEHWSGYITGSFEKKNFIYKRLAMHVLNNAKKILVVSQSLKIALTTQGIDEDKIEILPNVVETLNNDYSELSKKNDNILMLSVADLVDNIKNISDIIEVLNDTEIAGNLEYHIVGDGPDRNKLENLADSYNLLNKVIFFHGRKENKEVLKIIQSCDFLIINSNVETFSVVAAEALMAGKPVIVTRCGGPEYFVNNTNGILIKPGNKNELKAAIIKMSNNYKEYNPEKLKASIMQKFTSEKIGLQLKKLYDKVIV